MRRGEGGIVTGYTEPDHEGTELARVLAAMAGPPAPLILPPDEFAALRTVAEAAGDITLDEVAAARFKARFEAVMANPGPLRVLPSEHWKDRAEAAEAKLAAITDACRSIPTPIAERILAITGSEEEAGNG